MKFLYTKERAKDLKEQLELTESEGSDFTIADNTEEFNTALQNELQAPTTEMEL